MQLQLDRLSKHYGSKIAVDRLSITMASGVYGLLGANGAGKTTLMRLICNIQTPTSGDILFDGVSTRKMGEEYRCMLGYLPQNFGSYPEFTAIKFLMYMASLKGMERNFAKMKADELLELVGLEQVRTKKIKTFSGGMKQRVGIAQAMLNDPKILILDEPTAGLDPKERVRFRNLISSFSKDKIVILSTHIVSDVEYIADEILVMKSGCLVHKGAPQVITKEIKGCVWECVAEPENADLLAMKFNVGNLKNVGDHTVLRIISKSQPAEHAVPVEPTLEDLYLFYFNEAGENQWDR